MAEVFLVGGGGSLVVSEQRRKDAKVNDDTAAVLNVVNTGSNIILKNVNQSGYTLYYQFEGKE